MFGAKGPRQPGGLRNVAPRRSGPATLCCLRSGLKNDGTSGGHIVLKGDTRGSICSLVLHVWVYIGDIVTRTLTRRALEACGYDVTSEDGPLAGLLPTLSQCQADLLVVDLVPYEIDMPAMIALRSNGSPKLLLSTMSPEEARATTQFVGAVDHLIKPIGIDALVRAANRELEYTDIFLGEAA